MEYIIIIGGNMSNKGAQSMVFQVVNEMHKRYPKKKVAVFMTPKDKDMQSCQEIYNFDIVPFSAKDILNLCGGVQKAASVILGVSKQNIIRLKDILNNAFIVFDISGYSLSSNWKAANSIKYLYRIAIMKKYNIPTIIMPQSFGPFKYKLVYKWYIKWLGTKVLRYPKIIFAREDFSYDLLKREFNLKNILHSKDMVLLGSEIDKAVVLNKNVRLREYNVENRSVAIVPNEKLTEKFSAEYALNIYKTAIDNLIKCKRSIYIVQHSEADINLCKRLNEEYQDVSCVNYIQENLNCIEYDLLIKQFDFIIASRYHSLVHAFKQNIPCIAIGWAEKYESLMNTLNQSKYMVDARNFDKEDFLSKLNKMEKNYGDERRKISDCLGNIKIDIYEQIFREI